MGEISTIGLDIAKSVFQVHGVDGTGAVVVRKRISRSKLLACSSSARLMNNQRHDCPCDN
jgi:hypothetical protein